MTNAVAIRALSALGDPSRRAIFEKLADAPASVGEITRILPITQSAVSQHLRVLKEVGLVSDTPEGNRRIYRLDPRGIAAVREWLDSVWTQSLEAFAAFADEQANSEDKQ